MLRRGDLRAEKIEYPDGIGCCIWQICPDITDDEGFGVCWDFEFELLDDIIALLIELKDAPAEPFEDGE